MFGTSLLAYATLMAGVLAFPPRLASSPAVPGDQPTVTFACTLDYPQQMSQAVILARSIRKFGGALSTSPVRLYVPIDFPEVTDDVRADLSALEVTVRRYEIPPAALPYGLAGKPFAAAQAEADARGATDLLVLLAPNTLVLAEPKEVLLPAGKELGFSPVHHQNVGSWYEGAPDEWWERIFHVLGISSSAIWPMETLADRRVLRPYFSSGSLVVRPERGLMAAWATSFEALVDDAEIPRLSEGSRSVFLHQAALAGAMISELPRERMLQLSFRYNYPLFFDRFFGAIYPFNSLQDIATMRYEFAFESLPEDWQRGVKASAEVLEWISTQFGRSEAGVPQRGEAATGASPGQPDRSHDIVEAAKWGRLDEVQALLAADPTRVNAADSDGHTALAWAAIRGRRDVARFLVGAGADPNLVGKDGGSALHWAAYQDDIETMGALLKAGGDVSVRDVKGQTPLHVAARRGCLDVTNQVLNAGADPNAITKEGWSALSMAYRGGHPTVAQLLLSGGANLGPADQNGGLPGKESFPRPEPIAISRHLADQYWGRYKAGDGSTFELWREGDRIRLMGIADDDIVPVAADTFYCVREPCRVVFRRDDQGHVAKMDLDDLRQALSAEKVTDISAGHSYVGSNVCLACHDGGPDGGPAGHWKASRHSRAFETLTTPQARALAASREDYRDIADPSREPRCLMCHVTAAQNPAAVLADPDVAQEGVGCEACHGPGSDYVAPEIMADREAFLSNGGRIPNELTCRQCHRDERFSFPAMWDRVRH